VAKKDSTKELSLVNKDSTKDLSLLRDEANETIDLFESRHYTADVCKMIRYGSVFLHTMH